MDGSVAVEPSSDEKTAAQVTDAKETTPAVDPPTKENNPAVKPPAIVALAGEGKVAELIRLLDEKADINAVDASGQTALFAASAQGQMDAIRALIKRGASLDKAKSNGNTPLVIASAYGQIAAVRALVEAGADMAVQGDEKKTALAWANFFNRKAVSDYLPNEAPQIQSARFPAKRGAAMAFVAATAAERNITLIARARKGDVVGMRKLLDGGAGANWAASERGGETALLAACTSGQVDSVRLLIERKANVDLADANMRTPLMASARRGDTGIVSSLLGVKARADAADKAGSTAVFYAADEGHVDVLRLLLDGKANLNIAKKNGDTPLIAASYKNYMATVRALVEAGADVKARGDEDKAAHDWAELRGHDAITSFLLFDAPRLQNWTQSEREQWEDLRRERRDVRQQDSERTEAKIAAAEKQLDSKASAAASASADIRPPSTSGAASSHPVGLASDVAEVLQSQGYRLVRPDGKTDAAGLEEAELGGGRATGVYAARYDIDKQTYAIKVVKLDGLDDKQVKRVLKECELLAKMDNKNVVRYARAFKSPTGSHLFVVTVFCAGGTLAGAMSRGETKNYSAEKIANVALQICRGLAYLHKRGVLHRHLALENMLVYREPGREDRIKIADLGLAATDPGGQHEKGAGAVIRMASVDEMDKSDRVVYDPPEARAHHGSADVWSLGLVIAEICVGKPIRQYGRFMETGAFPAGSSPQLIEALTREVAARGGEKLKNLVAGMLALDVKERLTAAQCVEMLDPQATLDKIVKKLDKLEKKMSGLFQAVLNLQLDPSLKFIPRYVILVPGTFRKADKLFGWLSNIANRASEWAGLTETFHLYICDEGPRLLGHTSPPTEPLHKPIQIKIPGATLRTLAPLIRIMSALMVAARFTASVVDSGLASLIPQGLPFVDDLKKKADEWKMVADKLLEVDDTMALFEVDVTEAPAELKRAKDLKEAEGKVARNNSARSKNSASSPSSAGEGDGAVASRPKRLIGDCYNALKELLTDHEDPPMNEERDTIDDLLRRSIVRVVHPERGSIHWVAKKHLAELEAKGFRFSDAVGMGDLAEAKDGAANACCSVS